MAANLTPKSVREYIGARYVPVFSNPIEWSDTRGYEPLTIVTYQGNSYTSMQYVPTGIDIQNTAYWVLTGNYNAQIEQYRREVQEFDGRITANEEGISELETKVDDLERKPRHAVFIGDSFGVSTYTQGSLWWTYVAKELNAQEHVYNRNGATFNGTENTFYQQAQAAVAETSFNNADVVEVSILGGVNDGDNSVTTALNELITYLRKNFVNAHITVAANAGISSLKRSRAYNVRSAIANYSAVSPNQNVTSASLAYISMINGALGNDNLHPTQAGSWRLGRAMASLAHYGCLPRGSFTAIASGLMGTGDGITSNAYLVGNILYVSYAITPNQLPAIPYVFTDSYTMYPGLNHVLYDGSAVAGYIDNADGHPRYNGSNSTKTCYGTIWPKEVI